MKWYFLSDFLLAVVLVLLPASLEAMQNIHVRGRIKQARNSLSYYGTITILPEEERRYITQDYCRATRDCFFLFRYRQGRGKVKDYIYYQLNIFRVRPEISGTIIPCIASRDTRERTSVSEYVSRNSDKCQTFNVLKNLRPSSGPKGDLQLGITTWYMGQSNYQDIMEDRPTRVYVPFISSAVNTLSIFAFIYYRGSGVRCYFQLRNEVIRHNSRTVLPGNVVMFRYDIKTATGDTRSGRYTFTCARAQTTVIRRKIIDISIIKDMGIISPDVVTWFPKQDKSYFDLTLLSRGTEVKIHKVYKNRPSGVTLTKTYLSPVVYHIRVFFPPPKIPFQGAYTITAEYRSVTLTKQIIIQVEKGSASPKPYIIENTVDLENDNSHVYLALMPSIYVYKRIITRSYCEATGACELMYSEQYKKDGTKYASYKLTLYNVGPEITGSIQQCFGTDTLLTEHIVAGLSQCSSEAQLKVSPHFQGGPLELGLWTWYMGEAGYRNITLRDYARVYVPVYGEQQNVFIFGSAHFTSSVTCSLSRYGKKMSGTENNVAKSVKLYAYTVAATSVNTATYVFNCTGTYQSKFEYKLVRTINKIKTVELLFVKDGAIITPKIVSFYESQRDAEINVTVISTTPTGITVSRTTSRAPDNIIVNRFQDGPIQYTFQVLFPSLKASYSGQYSIGLTASSNERSSSTFELKVLQSPTVELVTTPQQLVVGFGQPAAFTCIVTGTSSSQYVRWWRADESQHSLISNITSTTTVDTVALQLHSATPKYADSGTYVCGCCKPDYVSTSTVKLLVATPGSPLIN